MPYNCTSAASNTIGSIVGFAGVRVTVGPSLRYRLTVASPPGIPATTMSLAPATALLGDDEVAVEDPGLDHRLAADAEHEQVAVAGEVGRQGIELLDVLLGQHVGAGGDIADEGHVANRPALHDRPRVGVPAHFDGPRLGGVAAQVAEVLQGAQVAVHGGR